LYFLAAALSVKTLILFYVTLSISVHYLLQIAVRVLLDFHNPRSHFCELILVIPFAVFVFLRSAFYSARYLLPAIAVAARLLAVYILLPFLLAILWLYYSAPAAPLL